MTGVKFKDGNHCIYVSKHFNNSFDVKAKEINIFRDRKIFFNILCLSKWCKLKMIYFEWFYWQKVRLIRFLCLQRNIVNQRKFWAANDFNEILLISQDAKTWWQTHSDGWSGADGIWRRDVPRWSWVNQHRTFSNEIFWVIVVFFNVLC